MKTQIVDYEVERLKASTCGFGFFAGDEIRLRERGGYESVGIVQWIGLKSGTISVRFPRMHNDSYVIINYFLYANDNRISKTGVRKFSPLFPKERIKAIYDIMTVNQKVFFLYHFYNCGKKAAEKTANRVGLSFEEVKKILKSWKDKKYL